MEEQVRDVSEIVMFPVDDQEWPLTWSSFPTSEGPYTFSKTKKMKSQSKSR